MTKAQAPAERDVHPGDRIANGRYAVDETLGEGAFGRVFRGRDLRVHERPVAIKHLKRDGQRNREVRERFLQEAAILARLDHPNVIGIHDIDEESYCIVLTIAGGGSVAELLNRNPNGLPPAEAVSIAIDTLRGLAAVHRQHLAPGRKPRTSSCWPNVDNRSDIWSVGAILSEMLTGKLHLPFERADNLAWADAVREIERLVAYEVAQPPSALSPAVPASLDSIVLRALRKDRAERFATADEMVVALKRVARRWKQADEDGQSPGPEAVSRTLQSATLAVRAGRADQALIDLAPLVARKDASDAALLTFARACVTVRDYARAQEATERLCRRPEAHAEAFALRGLCLLKMGRTEDGLAAYREGCQRFPRDASLREAHAVARWNGDAKVEARRVLGQALALDPERASCRRLERAWGRDK